MLNGWVHPFQAGVGNEKSTKIPRRQDAKKPKLFWVKWVRWGKMYPRTEYLYSKVE